MKKFKYTLVTLTMAHLFVLQKKDLRPLKEEMKPEEKEARAKKGHTGFLAGLFSEDYYFPPVDFMTAQVHSKVQKPKTCFKEALVNTPES